MKKRVALVINTLSNGGAERVVSNMTLSLSDYYDCDIIVNDASTIDYPVIGNIISLGMKPSVNRSGVLYQGKAFFVRLFKLGKLRAKAGYHAVISFSDSANVVNILTRKNCGKTVITVHTTLTKASKEKRYKYIVSPLVKAFYNRADNVVAVSQGIKSDLIKNYGILPDKVSVITNGCDNKKIAELAGQQMSDDEKRWIDNRCTIVTIGRLSEPKGYWHIIRALHELKQRNVPFRMVIMGRGELEEYLSSLINDLGLGDDVFLSGFCANPFKIMVKAQLFVSSSLWEGYPNNIVEAMSCGLPVISTDFDSGAREIIAPNTEVSYKNKNEIEMAQYGILTPVCDGKKYSATDPLTYEEKILADAIQMLLQDTDLREQYSQKSKCRALQLDLQKKAEEWRELVE